MGIDRIEIAIVLIVLIVFVLGVWRILRSPPIGGGPGPHLFGFGTVPVDEPPPPHDPGGKPAAL